MKKQLTVSLILLASFFGCSAQNSNDEKQIKIVITEFTQGVDLQKGSMISNAFRENAGFFATNQAKILSVTPAQLADMHEAKKFGGRDRKLTISKIDVTDEIIASAKVTAKDDVVHYVYYVSLSKVEGKWLIQSILQHSKML